MSDKERAKTIGNVFKKAGRALEKAAAAFDNKKPLTLQFTLCAERLASLDERLKAHDAAATGEHAEALGEAVGQIGGALDELDNCDPNEDRSIVSSAGQSTVFILDCCSACDLPAVVTLCQEETLGSITCAGY